MGRVENLFGPRENWGKGDEMAVVRERAASGAVRKGNPSVPLTRASSPGRAARGNGTQAVPYGKNETGVLTAKQAKAAGGNKDSRSGVRGFVSVKCQGCGKVINTCLREARTIFNCKDCGHPNPLERLTNIHFKCHRCGFAAAYRTNRREKDIRMECLNCSQPVAMRRIRRGNYVTAEEAGGNDPE